MSGGATDPVSRVDAQRSVTDPWDFSTAVLSLDPIFAAISHPRRRYLLYSLRSQSELTIQELAAELVEWEETHCKASVEADDPRHAYISLHHTHVPKLVECDVVEFDESTGVVTLGPNADRVLAALAGAGRSLDSFHESDPSLEETTQT